MPHRQEVTPGAGFRAQHWQSCTLLEAGGQVPRLAGTTRPQQRLDKGPLGRGVCQHPEPLLEYLPPRPVWSQRFPILKPPPT